MDSHIGDGIRDEEWRDFFEPLLLESSNIVLKDGEATHSTANQATHFGLVKLVKVVRAFLQACLFEGLLAGHKCVGNAIIVPPGILLVHKPGYTC